MGLEIPHRNRGADMRTKNQETLDRILKFVNKYYQEYHSSPTINDVAEGVGVARLSRCVKYSASAQRLAIVFCAKAKSLASRSAEPIVFRRLIFSLISASAA